MYSSTVTIVDTDHYSLQSSGRGAAYTLHHKGFNENLWFAGDDAALFWREFEAMESADEGRTFDSILRELWYQYSPS